MAKDRQTSDAGDRPAVDASNDSGGMNVGVAVVGFFLCFIAGMGLMWGIDAQRLKSGGLTADSSGTTWADDESPIPVSSKDPVWGSRSAPVTIVQFSDFQCPFCSKVEPTIDQIKTTYGPDKVRIVWKNKPLPMHPNAKPAAEAAQGVFALKGSDAFWKFHDTAFKNQSALSPASYETWAQASGVDLGKFKAGIAAHTWADKVEKDEALSTQVGVSGTPAAFVNGVLLSGAQPFDKFKAVIDQELQKAQAKIAGGTPKDRIYVTMSKENKTNAPPSKDEKEDKEDTTTVFRVPVGSSPVLGSKDALVTIVEFSDFQCPYCGRVEPTLKQIREKYGDKVRIVWKNEPLPFHPRAEPAAEVAMEARAEKGDKGFWDVHDKLFASQPKLDDPDLDKVAQEAGLNLEKVHEAMKTHKYKAQIDADNDLADDMQASGTPHFFVDGRRLVGAQPPEKFQKIIDEEIPKAQGLLAKGLKGADQVYDALIKDGKGAPELERKNIPLPSNAPARGNLSAKVTVVEFSDFQCPFCKRAEDSVNEVMKAYGDKIKFVWRNLPLPMHPDAPLAAQASMEAYKQKGSDGFWKMHDLLYANQPSQQKADGLKREALDGYAQQLGLDMGKWKTALDTQSHKAEVDADAKAGNDAGINGTPAFVINGYFINGAQPFPKFRKVIDRALAEAR
jgi:protein-disulfide isomerase